MQSIDQIQWPGWNVVRLIGRGSFGAVYEIQRDVFGETEKAALKVITIPENGADIDDLRVEGYDDESITSRFHSYLEDIVKEYSTMAKMKGHPNVVYCDDVKYVQHDDGIGWDIYIKMELLTPIMKCLDQVENEQSVIDLGIAMCNALVLCKERSIVHRDIKPQNIFVSQDGTFKLGDFGIAKTAERTTSGTKVGTYKYMAPEVYNNKPYGPAADQYSLGLVMYWLLNDRRTPFSPKKATASEEDEARKRRFDGEQIPPPAHGSKQLQAIVLKACAYDPKQRFASASEMLDALKAVKSGTAPSATIFQSGAASNSTAGAAVAGVGAVTAGNIVAGDGDLTSRTVGRRPNTPVEDGTVGRRPNRQANSGAGNNGQNNQQFNNTVSSAAVQQQEEKKKKRGAAAWIAIAAGLIVLIAGIALLSGLGKDKDKGGSQKLDASKPVETTNIRPVETANIKIDATETEGTETTETEPGETLPIQLDWADWAENLPDYVTDENYEIEERTLYSSRNLETTSSTTSSTMDGWELYDTATGNGDYGAWSDWSQTAVSKSDTKDVETQTRYRYSDKETTTSSSSSKSGWTLDNTTYSWGDYGAWSEWSTTAASNSDSRQVETQTRYRYRDKETTTSNSSSLSGWTQYNMTTSWGDWGSWSSWQTDSVSANDGRQVETKTQYRYRDISYTTQYTSWGSWSGWQDSYVASNDLTDVETRTAYHYYYYLCPHCGVHMYQYTTCFTWAGGCGGNIPSSAYHTLRSTIPYSSTYNFHGTGVNCADNTDQGRAFAFTSSSSQYYVAPITQYRYRTRSTYQEANYGSWSSWGDTSYSSSSTREIQTRTVYRYRTRSQVSTYYYYRWKEWSSWSTTAVNENDNRQVETTKYYRYRDRASIPTYHFSRWKDWSTWSTTAVSESSTRKVETKTFYRYRDRVTQTTYYFQRWTGWSDYAESPVEETSTTEVQTKTEYRYKSKG